MDDFLNTLYERPLLAIPKNTTITLYQLKDGQEVEIDVGDSPADYVTGNSRKNPLIVKTTAVFDSKLDHLEQEIMQLENSEEYKTLAHKNRVWAVPIPTEQDKGEWELLNKKLDELKERRKEYVNIFLVYEFSFSEEI